MLCKNCGKEMAAGETFCPACGTKAAESAAEAAGTVKGKVYLKRSASAELLRSLVLIVLVAVLYTLLMIVFTVKILYGVIVLVVLASAVSILYTQLGLSKIEITRLSVLGRTEVPLPVKGRGDTGDGTENTYVYELLIENKNPAEKKIQLERYIKSAIRCYGIKRIWSMGGLMHLMIRECAFESPTLPPGEVKIVCEMVTDRFIRLHHVYGNSFDSPFYTKLRQLYHFAGGI